MQHVVDLQRWQVDLDFCKLEVTVLHSIQGFESAKEKLNNVAAMVKYFDPADKNEWANERKSVTSDDLFQFKFDNTQLNCELKVVDSIDDEGDNFIFKVWNIPETVIFYPDDFLLFKYYWETDPKKYTTFHGLIKKVKSNRLSSDLETTIKGELVNQAILYGTSVFQKFPKLTQYSDVKNFVENELNLEFVSMIPGFSQKTKLVTPILTRGKSVGVIMELICKELTDTTLKTANPLYPNDVARWKFLPDGQTILVYRDSDLISKNSSILNNDVKMTVSSVDYNDLLEFTDVGDGSYVIQIFGLPTIKAGVVFYINTKGAPSFVTAESAYYVVDEVEHNISLADGFIMKAYVRKTQ